MHGEACWVIKTPLTPSCKPSTSCSRLLLLLDAGAIVVELLELLLCLVEATPTDVCYCFHCFHRRCCELLWTIVLHPWLHFLPSTVGHQSESITHQEKVSWTGRGQMRGGARVRTRALPAAPPLTQRGLATPLQAEALFASLKAHAHEDTSVGSWMMGLEATYVDDNRLCCSSSRQEYSVDLVVSAPDGYS
ncbi:hypothetical protein Taro_044418 [Colocasia esculenta]|uniref:Uncharacterized protein n=1 Tax=Colocasia esculenta TaxID=4460 RepID=A0A843WNN3_COLES|nr:hypothetical protein [Colocasia esculenta]